MADDYFSNGQDDEYWDDVYFEEHKDEYSSGGSWKIGKVLGLIFCLLWGLMTIPESPMAGIMIIVMAVVFIGLK